MVSKIYYLKIYKYIKKMKVAIATFCIGDEYKERTYLGRVSLDIYCKKNNYDIAHSIFNSRYA